MLPIGFIREMAVGRGYLIFYRVVDRFDNGVRRRRPHIDSPRQPQLRGAANSCFVVAIWILKVTRYLSIQWSMGVHFDRALIAFVCGYKDSHPQSSARETFSILTRL